MLQAGGRVDADLVESAVDNAEFHLLERSVVETAGEDSRSPKG
jgi:hypothetical protein